MALDRVFTNLYGARAEPDVSLVRLIRVPVSRTEAKDSAMGSANRDSQGANQQLDGADLATRIAAAQRKHAKPDTPEPIAAHKQAMRVGLDLVAGTLVGFVLGFAFDKAFGTKPFGLIVLLLLGVAAGFRNSFRELQRLQNNQNSKDQ